MTSRFALVLISLAIGAQSQAATPDMDNAARQAGLVAPGGTSSAYSELQQNVLIRLRHSLKSTASNLTQQQVDHARQNGTQADQRWLMASGYDFQIKDNQQAGIALLDSFKTLTPALLAANLATVTKINHAASLGTRHLALIDADGIGYLYFLADALGPKLGNAFLVAYDKGEMNKAAALIKASEVSTGAAKDYFHFDRPFLIPGNQIHLVPDTVVVRDEHAYGAMGGAFPSGHTNTGYTDALLLAEMVPERFAPLVIRGARYGYSRVVLGVHYPLDVMGSRMIAQRNVAHYLSDPQYRTLFDQAKIQLRAALEKECGSSLTDCASDPAGSDPYRDPAMYEFYRFTMTYGLPQLKPNDKPLRIPPEADALLADVLPQLTPARRKTLIEQTALASGYGLSGSTAEQDFWQRLDLPAAWAAAQIKK